MASGIGDHQLSSEIKIYEAHKLNQSLMLRFFKRTIDIFVAAVFLVAFGWLFLALYIGVVCTSGFPAIYSQPRFGREGKVFRFYKLRSMVKNANVVLEEHLKSNADARQQWADFQKLQHDPRITRFGSFIRRTSLDEIPQFWNVLIGDMSIIGPRPCMLSQRDLYGADWSYYCSVRPGISGLWQVSGRNNLSYKQRVELDVAYVRNISLFNDFRILIKTAWVVLSRHGSR